MALIFSYIKRHIITFILAVAFLVVEAVTDIFQPALMSNIVDEGVTKSDTGAIWYYGILMLIIAGIGAVSAVVRNVFSTKHAQAVAKDLRRDIYKKTQTLSLENIDRISTASIITRITNDVTQVQEFVTGFTRIIFKAPITTISAIVMVVTRTPWLVPTMLIVIAISVFIMFLNIRIGYPKFAVMQQKIDKLNHVAGEYLSGVRVVKAFNASKNEESRFDRAADALRRAGLSAMKTMAVFGPLINLTVNISIVVLLMLAHAEGGGHIGRVMASINYMTQILFSLMIISNIFNRAIRALASSERIKEVLDEKPAQTVPVNALTPAIEGGITFKNVSFAYPGSEKNALTDISFTCRPGQTIGIIGPTGSGKSTLTYLIPRFYDATSGQVLIDGTDVTRAAPDHIRANVATAPQKALLFTGTILDNLHWGSPDAGEDDVHKALEISDSLPIIESCEGGLNCMIGQGGVNLSGGQKQRLSLARALLKKPKILILDDCTSALDATTEANVLKGLREYAKDITVLLISQRISTVRRADKILCLDNGVVQGFGTHSELMEGCGEYRAIYESQIGA